MKIFLISIFALRSKCKEFWRNDGKPGGGVKPHCYIILPWCSETGSISTTKFSIGAVQGGALMTLVGSDSVGDARG